MPDFIHNSTTTLIMKKFIFFPVVFVFLLLFSEHSFGQQDAQFSHNMFNILSYNPAFAGSNGDICMTILGRQQWMGFNETDKDGNNVNVSPQTFLFSIDAAIKPIKGGIGAVVYKDKLGHEDNVGLKFGYAYKRILGPGIASAGLQAGFLNKTINYAGFVPIEEGDPLLMGSKESAMIFDMAGGLFYKVPGEYYAGISTTQFLQTQSEFSSAIPLGSPKLKSQYYLTGGYQYTLPSNPSFELWPSLLIKTDFASAQYDINCLVMYNQQFWGGLSYRVDDAIVFLAGARPIPSNEDLRLGIAYDFTTSALGSGGKSFGTAEIYINYCFRIIIPPVVSSYKNVRFL
jgi:type IX secretion system PorP/SprF family membrane protein